MGASEDRKDGLTVEVAPLRVRTRHVTDESTVRAGVTVEQERKMCGIRHSGVSRDKQTKGVCFDEVEKLVGIGPLKSSGHVHRLIPHKLPHEFAITIPEVMRFQRSDCSRPGSHRIPTIPALSSRGSN